MKRIVFALALLITSWSFASLTDGLVGYWPFDGNVKDGSGRGHKLSGSVAYTADRNGNDNSAAVFEGNASLKLPQSLYVARSLTASVWCKPSGTIPTGLRDMLSQTDGATMVGSQYVLYPSHGGLASTGKAGVGLVVGQNRCYHLVSRLAHRAFFLDDEEKVRAVALMRRVEAGVQAGMSYCINRTVSIS